MAQFAYCTNIGNNNMNDALRHQSIKVNHTKKCKVIQINLTPHNFHKFDTKQYQSLLNYYPTKATSNIA